MIVWGGSEPTTSTGGRYCACPLGRLVYRDGDGDGFGDPGSSLARCDGSIPAGYVADATDCNDANASVYPGAVEVCNGIDDNCDGTIDEGFTQQTYFRDADGDTYGNPTATLSACAPPPRYVSNSTDCDDTNAGVHPGAAEVCNGIDDDCNGIVDDGGGIALCDDGKVCTTDSCLGTSGCTHSNNTAPCDDGNACTIGDICGGGTCHPGSAVVCNDSNACTTDSCNPASGCVYTPISCNDNNRCTDDGCNPAMGCVFTNDTSSCDDGNVCTQGDVCGGGICNPGAPVVCSDGNPCTDGSCNPDTGCVFANNTSACDDGNACTVGDTCSGGVCNPGTPRTCDDGNPCNGVETCNAATGCVSGTPLICNDGNPCTDDACSPATGCFHTYNTATCDDGNSCTVGDSCNGGACSGTPIMVPSETHDVAASSDKATYSWAPAAEATQYDVVRGVLAAFPIGAGGSETCFDNLPATTLNDGDVPAPGSGFWYLSRGENTCGIGPWGNATSGPRTTTTCP